MWSTYETKSLSPALRTSMRRASICLADPIRANSLTPRSALTSRHSSLGAISAELRSWGRPFPPTTTVVDTCTHVVETFGRRFLSEGTPYGSGSGLLWPGSLPQQRLSGQVPPDELSRRDNVDALKSRGSQKSAVPGHDAGSLTRDRAREEHQVVW